MRTRSWLALLALVAGCDVLGGDDDKTDTPADTDTDTDTDADADADTDADTDADADADTDTDTDPPTGDGTLAFEVVWGANIGGAFQDNLWQSIIDLNLYETDGHEVAFLLCETDDPTCEAPVVARTVAPGETSGDLIQGRFGPDIALADLPEGEFLLMVVVDSALSIERGLGFDDAFATTETAWGGRVSEFDAMLSDEPQAPFVNPEPTPLLVDTRTGSELGPLTLSHFHQRDVSPAIPYETGRVVIALEDGVRLIDTSTYEVEDAPGFLDETFQMLTPGYAPVDGSVCGMVDAGDGLVWLLYDGFDNSGFAIPFDAAAAQQAGNHHRVDFGPGEAPCRGVAGEIDGRPHLFAMSAGASRINELEGSAGEDFWAVDVSGIDRSDLAATKYDDTDDAVFKWGIDDLVVHDDRLFLSVSPATTDFDAPGDCLGMHCLFEAEVGPGGQVDVRPGGGLAYTVMLEQADDVTTASGTIACEWENPWAAVTSVAFHDGRDLLFLGGCTQIVVMDLDTGALVDLDPGVFGQQNLDASLYGQGFNAFSLSPDGETLWALPQRKSPIHMFVQKGLDPTDRQGYNRYMVLPIDLSTGTEPAPSAAYQSGDIDGYAGPPIDIGQYDTPADDPGVDLNFAHAVVYQLHWLPSTAGSTFQAASIPTGPSFAATGDSLWVRGSGITGLSGLGKAGDVEVIDLGSRQPILFPGEGDAFYGYWTGTPAGDIKTGFDLTPGVAGESRTLGIVFVP